MVEIEEENGHELPGAAAAHDGVLDPLEKQNAVWQPGQGVVDRSFVGAGRGILKVRSGLGIHEVSRGHVGQRLGRLALMGAQLTRCISVQIERPEAAMPLPQREGEHRAESDRSRLRAKLLEPFFVPQVGYEDCLSGATGSETGSFVKLGLQLLEFHRLRV